jgi:hypothetical protein
MNDTAGTMMTISDAQKDMRASHVGGSGGMIVSGIVWLVAGIVSVTTTSLASVATLFFGGMTIYPLGVVVARMLGGSGQHQKNNPMATLALETTVLLYIGLFVAFSVYQQWPIWFFPIMLVTIGGRYVIFSTIYGMRLYWLLGAVLILAGGALILVDTAFPLGAFVGGGIEIVFGLLTLGLIRRD